MKSKTVVDPVKAGNIGKLTRREQAAANKAAVKAKKRSRLQEQNATAQ